MKKYIKYKQKYLELKNITNVFQYGGKLSIQYIKNINLFIDPDMEQFLNPIYGLIMSRTNYIENIFMIGPIIKHINPENSKIIEYDAVNSIVTKTNNEYKPSNILFLKESISSTKSTKNKYINTKSIGRYIALLYFCKNSYNKLLIDNVKKDKSSYFQETINNMVIRHTYTSIRSTSVIKIQNKIPLGTENKNMFHLLLYCVWWISDSIHDIIEYYNGINETFEHINEIIQNTCDYPYPNIYQTIEYNSSMFTEYTVEDLKFIKEEQITNFNLALAKVLSTTNFEEINFKPLPTPENDNKIFSDCVETGLRNFINILIFEDNHLNIERLSALGAIKALQRYYKRYNNFKLLLTEGARKQWILLLGEYAKNRIEFNEPRESSSSFNIKSSITNFKQLLINLFLPETIDDSIDIFQKLIEKSHDLIEEIKVNNNNILIKNINLEVQTFIIDIKHLKFEFKNSVKYDIDNIELENEEHQDIIKILLKSDELIPNKYLHHIINNKYIPEFMNQIINIQDDLNLNILIIGLKSKIKMKISQNFAIYLMYKGFFETKYKDLFMYLTIVLKNLDFILFIGLHSDRIPELNQISFTANDSLIEIKFTDGKDLSPLDNLLTISDNFMAGTNITTIDLTPFSKVRTIGNNFMADTPITTIDLTPFENIESIGDNFLYYCHKLKTINNILLKNIKTIGNSFLFYCNKLENIDLGQLEQLESIGDSFLDKCYGLKTIKNLSSLRNLKTIGNKFLNGCEKLIIDLLPFGQLKTIGNNFLSMCNSIEYIDFSQLEQLESIGNNFLFFCYKLENIDLSRLVSLNTIGNGFLENLLELKTVNISSLNKIKTIGNNFLADCKELTSIDLSPLINIESIGDYFLCNCESLETIENFSSLIKLETIGNNFLSKCIRLPTIENFSLLNLKTIGNEFLFGCENLITIDISFLNNIKNSGNDFLSDCINLINIDISPLENLEIIGNDFLFNCTNLDKIICQSEFKNLKIIGNNFLSGCTNLTEIDCNKFIQLETIGDNFLFDCVKLLLIDLTYSKSLKEIGNNFVFNSTGILDYYGQIIKMPQQF